MQQTDNNIEHTILNIEHLNKKIIGMSGYKREDFSVCLGCKICASVCTVNDLSIDANPQELLSSLFLGRTVEKNHPLVLFCTNCYRCTHNCPWGIRIPEIIRAFRETLGIESQFEKAFKGAVKIWGRVYEPYVFLKSATYMLKEGYIRYVPKWFEYMSFHLPYKIKGR